MFDACEIENQVQVLGQEFCFDEDKILLDKGNYIVKIVSNARELDEALSLRFKVFNLELRIRLFLFNLP